MSSSAGSRRARSARTGKMGAGEIQKFPTIGCDQAVGGSMSRLTVMLGIVGIVGLPLTLGGCAGALLVGALAGAAGGGYAAAQERGVNGAVSDLDIETNVESGFSAVGPGLNEGDRKSTRLNSSHMSISYAVFCLKKKIIR